MSEMSEMSETSATSATMETPKPPSEDLLDPEIAAAKARRLARRSGDFSALDISTYGSFYDRGSFTSQTLKALAGTHPRLLWSIGSRALRERPRDGSEEIVLLFARHPALVRAALWRCSSQTVSGMRHAHHEIAHWLPILLTLWIQLPGQTERGAIARLRAAAKMMSNSSAAEIFRLHSAAARANLPQTALMIAREMMPSARDPDKEQSRRHTFGETGFAQSRMSRDSKARRASQALADWLVADEPKEALAPETIGAACGNGFELAVRCSLSARREGRLELADLWAQSAAELIRKGRNFFDHAETLTLGLALEATREAMRELRPRIGDVTFYSFDREELLFHGLSLCAPDQLGALIAYEATSDAASKPDSLPGWTMALLAGHAPDPSWMPAAGSAEALRRVKVSDRFVEMAAAGQLDADHWRSRRGRPSGRLISASSLLDKLGHATMAQAYRAAERAAAKALKAAQAQAGETPEPSSDLGAMTSLALEKAAQTSKPRASKSRGPRR